MILTTAMGTDTPWSGVWFGVVGMAMITMLIVAVLFVGERF